MDPPKKKRPKRANSGRRRLDGTNKGRALLVRLTTPQRAWLDGASASRGVPVAVIVRDLIDAAAGKR